MKKKNGRFVGQTPRPPQKKEKSLGFPFLFAGSDYPIMKTDLFNSFSFLYSTSTAYKTMEDLLCFLKTNKSSQAELNSIFFVVISHIEKYGEDGLREFCRLYSPVLSPKSLVHLNECTDDFIDFVLNSHRGDFDKLAKAAVEGDFERVFEKILNLYKPTKKTKQKLLKTSILSGSLGCFRLLRDPVLSVSCIRAGFHSRSLFLNEILGSRKFIPNYIVNACLKTQNHAHVHKSILASWEYIDGRTKTRLSKTKILKDHPFAQKSKIMSVVGRGQSVFVRKM